MDQWEFFIKMALLLYFLCLKWNQKVTDLEAIHGGKPSTPHPQQRKHNIEQKLKLHSFFNFTFSWKEIAWSKKDIRISGLKNKFFHGNLKHMLYVLKAMNFLPRKSFQELSPCLFQYLLDFS